MIRFAIIAIVIGCTHAAPVAAPVAQPARVNLVCAMLAVNDDDRASVCEDKGHEDGHGDIAFVTRDGGTKVCWMSFGEKQPLVCHTLSLSKADEAARAVALERERVKQEAAKSEVTKPAEVTPTPALKAMATSAKAQKGK